MSLNLVQVPCVECGELTPKTHANVSYCQDHRPTKPKPANRVYDPVHDGYAWKQLSLRARSLQDYCLDCGTSDNLTADHLPESWLLIRMGLPVTLREVEVVCQSCNSHRDSSDLGTERFGRWVWSGGLERFFDTYPHLEKRARALVAPHEPFYIPPRKGREKSVDKAPEKSFEKAMGTAIGGHSGTSLGATERGVLAKLVGSLTRAFTLPRGPLPGGAHAE